MNKIDYNFVHEDFQINDFSINRERLLTMAIAYVKEGLPHMQSIGRFLLDWLDQRDYIEATTSGSTGLPKIIHLKKEHMVNSALATGEYLHLRPKNKALLCLPADFIAGKMMIVRAIILGLHLEITQPSSMPLALTKNNFDFAAMIPLQASKSFYDLNRIRKLILGGASIDNNLEEKLRTLSSRIYASYGMTETVSHVAMRKVNHTKEPQKSYTALPNVTFSQDVNNCLIIDAPKISDHKIITNDVVRLLSPTEFEWLGRHDNVINSAGFKVFPESVEHKLGKHIQHPYFIISEPDNELGNRAVLYIEANQNQYPNLQNTLHKDKEILKYEVPREIYFVPSFVMTDNRKIRRKETVEKYNKK